MSLDALKVLYESKQNALRILSERSFTTTLQALALNIVAIAGLIGGKITLSTAGKILGTITIIVFNGAVIIYLISKSLSHHREKEILNEIEGKIRVLAVLPPDTTTSVSFCCSFFGGSFLMIFCVLVACVSVIIGLLLKLVG